MARKAKLTKVTLRAAFRHTDPIAPDGSTEAGSAVFAGHDEADTVRSSFLQISTADQDILNFIEANPGMWEVTFTPKGE